ncbi:MAG: hypothetical protein H0U74_01465 [Bradymonadaceae bacterium]|nr:hypothetical protein [Lujinxingiaceae bacterium]
MRESRVRGGWGLVIVLVALAMGCTGDAASNNADASADAAQVGADTTAPSDDVQGDDTSTPAGPYPYDEVLVAFSVEEASGISGRRHVTGGIPFGRDVLPASGLAGLRLVDDQDRAIAMQATITARWSWPEGSVQWVLLDFQTQFTGSTTRHFKLVKSTAPPLAASARLKLEQRADAIVVDTGQATVEISKQSFALFAGVKVGEQVVTGLEGGDMRVDLLKAVPEGHDEENWLRDAPAGDLVELSAKAGADYQAEVELENELRAVIKLTGTLGVQGGQGTSAARFPYIVRLTFHAGQPYVHVHHTLIYDGDVKTETIRRIGLDIPLAGESALSFDIGGQGADPLAVEPEAPARPAAQTPGAATGALGAGESVSLLAVGPAKRFHDAPRYALSRIAYSIDRHGPNATEPLGQGDSPRGYIGAGSAPGGSVTAALRDFWQRHPKELEVDADARSLNVWLWPNRGDKVLDLRRHSEQKAYENLRPGEGWRYEGVDQDIGYAYGRALTHEMAFSFAKAAPSAAAGERLVGMLNEPLYVLCSPQYYAETQALGPIAPYQPERFPRIEGAQDLMLEWLMRNQIAYGWYGLIDYGDLLMEYNWFHVRNWGERREGWMSRGYSGWINNDGQLDHVLYVQALRRGDRKLLKFAEALTRHTAEIDTAHLEMPGTGGTTGLGINDNFGRPRVGGVSRHSGQHWGDYVTSRGTVTHGSVVLYGLTGNLRLLDVMKEIAGFHTLHWNYEATDSLGLARFYQVLGDEAMLARAHELRGGFIEGQGFTHFNNRIFALWYYGQVAQDAELGGHFAAQADAIAGQVTGGYLYNQGITEIFAYHLTGDRRHLEALPGTFVWLGKNNFEAVDRRDALAAGPESLAFSELWQRVRAFQAITPEKTYHIAGLMLGKWPFTLAGLEDESFLD